jgi:hypothetical protein
MIGSRLGTVSLVALALAACSSDDDSPGGSSGGTGGGGTGGAGGSSGSGGATGGSGGGSGGGVTGCTTACENGEVCVVSACCAEERACGSKCCGASEVCSFQKCVTPGASCTSSAQCAPGEYCEPSLSSGPITTCAAPKGRCLPRPPQCSPGQTENCVEKCEVPVSQKFDPVVKYSWPADVTSPTAPYASDVMMTPLVIQLDDDDCDGQVTAMDAADILVTTFSGGAWQTTGVLHALSIKKGAISELWSAPGISPGASLAGGNLDGKNGNEIVACAAGGGSVLAFSADGKPLWTAAASCFMPAIADLDGDGAPEVVVGGGIIDGATGAVKKLFSPVPSGYHTVGDLDGNGKPEIVFANRVYDGAGALSIDLTASISGTWLVPSLVDFDKDGKPEVIATLGDSNSVVLWRYDAAEASKAKILRAPFKAHVDPGGAWGWSFGMGPITAGDFDGDGTPDAGFVGFRGYVVLDGKKLMNGGLPSTLAGLALWSKPTDEDNGSTGSAVFDFDGDGKVEVLYNDTQRVHIYDGKTGQDTATPICNTTGSLLEYPVVADVDADGQADVVLVANSFSNKPGSNPSYICDGTMQSGVRVLGSASKSWVQTRPVWNQHTYHVTNVGDDGTIPKNEASNWTVAGLNNFRQNKQVGGEFGAPDAVVTLLPNCAKPYGVRVFVRNVGSAPMPAGVTVNVHREGGKLLGTTTTTHPLFPLQVETLIVPVPAPDDVDLSGGKAKAYAVVDPAPKKLVECRPDNNQSPLTAVGCAIVR